MGEPALAKDRWLIGGFFLICLVFFSPVILGLGNFWEDLILLEYPARVFSRNSLQSLQFPHWNPYAFNGTPFFSTLSSGVLYPFNLLLSFLPVSDGALWYFIQLNVVGHFAIAGACMFAYGRHRKMSAPAASFAALGFMLSGFFVAHIIHSMMLYIVAWIPLIVLFLERGIEGEKPKCLLIAGVILGLSTLAGHPQISLYEFLFLGSYALVLWFGKPDRNLRSLSATGLPFLVAIGLSLILVLPALEMSANSSRASWTFQQASESSLHYVHLLTALIPNLFGGWTEPGSGAPGYWMSGPSYGYYTYWDTCFYVGVLTLIFGALQVVRGRADRFVRFAIVWWIVSFLFALGSHSYLYKLFFDFVPGFDRFRAPGRITFTWVFLLPALAARTVDLLKDEAETGKIMRPLVAMASLCLIFALAAVSGMLGNLWPEVAADQELATYLSFQGLILLMNVAVGYGLLVLIASKRISLVRGQWLLVLALAIDLFVFGFGTHVTDEQSPADYFSTNAEQVRYFQDDRRAEIFRVNSRQFDLTTNETLERQRGMIVGLNQGMIDELELVEGYHPLKLTRRLPPAVGREQYAALLDLLNVKYYVHADQIGPNAEVGVLMNGDRMPRAQMFYRARVLPDDDAVRAVMTAGSFDYRNELLLTEDPGLPDLSRSPAAIRNQVVIHRYSPNRIDLTVDTEEAGLLWLSEIWYPAWKAYVDGEEVDVLIADYSFRAIPVPAGSHDIRFVYRSDYFRAGFLVSLATALIVAGALMGFPKRLWLRKDSTAAT